MTHYRIAAGQLLKGYRLLFEQPIVAGRKWRADIMLPDESIVIEIDGGVFTQGRHTRGQGFIKDIDKANATALLGWTLFRCTPQTVCKTFGFIKEWLDAGRPPEHAHKVYVREKRTKRKVRLRSRKP